MTEQFMSIVFTCTHTTSLCLLTPKGILTWPPSNQQVLFEEVANMHIVSPQMAEQQWSYMICKPI